MRATLSSGLREELYGQAHANWSAQHVEEHSAWTKRVTSAVFDAHGYDREALAVANERYGHDLVVPGVPVDARHGLFAAGLPAVCSSVHDRCETGRIGEPSVLDAMQAVARGLLTC